MCILHVCIRVSLSVISEFISTDIFRFPAAVDSRI